MSCVPGRRASPSSFSSTSCSTRRCRWATPMLSATASRPCCKRPFPRPRLSCMSTAGTIAKHPGRRLDDMAGRPAFVVEDQSEVIDFLTAHLRPERRIDTHGAVVFLAGERGYKLKRAVKFPYMDFSTVERRAAMCAAEIEIHRPLPPEVYLGPALGRRGRAGRLPVGHAGGAADHRGDR